MTNNGESIYKIRANFFKMKEHVTRTTRTTDKNITRCFVITFEYNMTIIPLLKIEVLIIIPFNFIYPLHISYWIGTITFYHIQRRSFGILLAICLHYISNKHIIFSNHSLGWFYDLAVHLSLTFILLFNRSLKFY